MRVTVWLVTLLLITRLAAAQTAGEREHATAIHKAVDRLVEATPRRSAGAIADGVSRLLHSRVPDRDYGDPPTARPVSTRNGSGLLVTYNILGDRHDSRPAIRAYLRSAAGTYRFVAVGGDDFADGFTVRSRIIQSPLSSEAWLMVWGPKEGFNGTLVRVRLFAFDGESLRTIWTPGDMLDAALTFRDNGFAIKHVLRDRLPWELVRDDYIATPDGPSRVMRRNAN